MKIIINGKEESINGEKVSINELLRISEVKSPDLVSVQLNNKFVRKEDFATIFPNENDKIDFLYFMGGGQLSC